MDIEHIEEVVDLERKMKDAGYISVEHYERFRSEAIQGMLHFGDSFTRGLGWALNEANLHDSLKILRYWNQTCQQAAIIFKADIAKKCALAELDVNDQ